MQIFIPVPADTEILISWRRKFGFFQTDGPAKGHPDRNHSQNDGAVDSQRLFFQT